MRVCMIQHPVGQGCLSSGELGSGRRTVRWLYDCGSNQEKALRREIDGLPGERFDFLFLSHLDSDHVSGIDHLLSQREVREVVLPYLAEEALIAAVARDAVRGRLSGLFLDCVSDMPGWFGRRGVEFITFVRGRDDDEEGDRTEDPIPGFPRERERDGDPSLEMKWSEEPQVSREQPIEASAALPRRKAVVQEVSPDAMLISKAGYSPLNWTLIPYVHKPPDRLLTAFRAALAAEFGTPPAVADILDGARTDAGRKKLRRCYDALWRDHNLVSMTLYSGPRWYSGYVAYSRLFRSIYYRGLQWRWHYGFAVGWMLTGDAHLDGMRRRRAFHRHYEPVSGFVGTFMLPHHGSAHNFDRSLLTGFPSLQVAFAAAGPNSYGHPHPAVRWAVARHSRARFRRVSDRPVTALAVELMHGI